MAAKPDKPDKPFRRPDQQGRVDGMCAVYSVLNCVKLLFDHSEDQDDALFQALVDGNARLFPKIVYGGTGVPGMRGILNTAQAWVRDRHPKYAMEWSAPVMRSKFAAVEPYFDHLRSTLGRRPCPDTGAEAQAWIVGLNIPWDHWTCVRDLSDKLVYFYDSYGMRRYRRDSFTLDRRLAGDGKGQKILVDYHQSFLVGRVRRGEATLIRPKRARKRSAVVTVTGKDLRGDFGEHQANQLARAEDALVLDAMRAAATTRKPVRCRERAGD